MLLGGAVPGTTSACAENTACCRQWRRPLRNYLRMRGEYALITCCAETASELPPRTRRIQHRRYLHRDRYGTTSACAENTPAAQLIGIAAGNYLRARGEYGSHRVGRRTKTELPPRARRIHLFLVHQATVRGTTSACAENTGGRLHRECRVRNYLRVCGEYHSRDSWAAL